MELIQQLIGNLGINEEQAKGGAGLLFNLAKEKLGAGDFQQLADKIPGVTRTSWGQHPLPPTQPLRAAA
jgi:hypothetical protein